MPRPDLSHSIARVVVLAVTIAGASLPLAAQAREPIRISAVARRQTEADSLEARAARLSSIPRGWLDAARLERRAARLRGDDPRAIANWSRAAWAYAAAGKRGPARELMEQAAGQAAAGGDVERSASAYLDAALIASEDGRDDLVPGLLRRMDRMMESPLLRADRRAVLLARLDATPLVARSR